MLTNPQAVLCILIWGLVIGLLIWDIFRPDE